jgi:HEAT repeat protein
LSFVRDIINILSETKSDQAVFILQKAVDNKNIKIRQEVIKGLIPIGGKKAAGLLGKFLKDEDSTVQLMAIRGFTEIKRISAEDAKPLMTFLSDRPLNKKEQALTLEAIKALEKAGGPAAEDLLKGYTKVRWWRSRKLQVERKEAALKAIEKIKRRQGIGGSAKP